MNSFMFVYVDGLIYIPSYMGKIRESWKEWLYVIIHRVKGLQINSKCHIVCLLVWGDGGIYTV